MSFSPLKSLHEIVEAAADETIVVGGLENTTQELTFQDINVGPVTLSQLLAASGSFLDLNDTPASYIPNGVVVVNAAGTALEFSSFSAGTFLSLTDTPGTYVGSAGVLASVNALENALEFSPGVTADAVRCAEPDIGGVLLPGDGQLQFENATQVRIKAGAGIIVDRMPGGVTTCRQVTWPDIVHTVSNIAGSGAVLYLEDPGATGTAQVIEFPSIPDTDQVRSRIGLGWTLHDAGAIVGVASQPDVWHDNIRLMRDALRAGGDVVNVVDGVAEEIPSTLTFSTTNHELFAKSANFHNPGGDANPNFVIAPGSNPQQFDLIAGDGTVFSQDITVLPNQWNNGGTLTNLFLGQAVIHQIVIAVDGTWWVQAGTTAYVNFNQAAERIALELTRNPLWEPLSILGDLRYVAIIDSGATEWELGSAELIPVGGGVGGGGGVSEFVELSDTPNSYTGEGGKLVAVKGDESGLEFINASGGGGGGVLTSHYVWVSTNSIGVGTTPGAVQYDQQNNAPDATYLTYSAPDWTVVKDCRVHVQAVAGFSAANQSLSPTFRLEVVVNQTTNKATGDAAVYNTTTKDNQTEVHRTMDLNAGDKFRIYCYTLNEAADVWGSGQNRAHVEVLEDLS